MNSFWKKCGVCKKEIGFQRAYQKCSISSCKKHTFCSVDCWAVHDSVMGHKSAYAEEERSPSAAEFQSKQENSSSQERPRRRIVVNSTTENSSNPSHSSKGELPSETLIVVSKLKNYVKAKSGMNTSGDVPDELSNFVRAIVNRAVDEAHKEGRKTLMARDFKNIEIN